jgi:energy-coupling factor transporter ATP-binding protein EcfA2
LNPSDAAREVLSGLRAELEADLAATADLTAVRRRAARLARLARDLDAQLERVEAAAVVTLVGSTGAGKSTLLNALVGRPVAREGEQRPTTSAPVIYRPRDADLRELLAELPGGAPEVVDYDPAHGPWSDLILIDAPDTNSVAAEHRDVVRALAERSDVLLVVAHRQSVAELSSVSFVDAFAGRRGLLLVLGRSDELTDDAREQLLAQLAEIARARWSAPDARVLAVSARRAQVDPHEPGWRVLRDELEALARGGTISGVRRHNALGTAAHLSALFGEVEEEAGAALEALASGLQEGLGDWRGRVAGEVELRLGLRRADLRGLLWNEVAKRWDGPGGWSLRAGGLSALGLGAGAVLARRNPLLAAGAAAGALAADKARGALRTRSFADMAGLLPGASELDAWYHAALGPARVTAGRLTDEPPEALGVPAAGALAQRAGEAVGEAWERVLERDLPDVAGRAVPLALRWLVDLPVFALGGFVVWRAARGFLESDYVGLDFLLNAALLLLAWLFVARALVRALLGRRATGLLAGARADAAQRLGQAAELEHGAAADAIARRRAALGRLAGLARRWQERVLGG